jgi:hypothetical protein
MLRNLSSLAPFSILGTVGLGFTALAMAFRYLSGSYATATPLLAAVAAPLQPAFGVAGWKAFFKPKSAILLCMLSTAYLAHYNAPKFFNELQVSEGEAAKRARAGGGARAKRVRRARSTAAEAGRILGCRGETPRTPPAAGEVEHAPSLPVRLARVALGWGVLALRKRASQVARVERSAK